MEQAGWLNGIAALEARRELRRLASDRELLRRAIIREIDDINAGLKGGIL